MNRNELHGGARYIGGKVEKKIGDVFESREWQVDGVVDQVAGGAEHMYGRARSIAGDAVDAAPGMIDDARKKLDDFADRTGKAARRGAQTLTRTVGDNPTISQLAGIATAAATGYAVGWLVHGRR